MGATTTNPLVRLYGHRLTPAARAELLDGLLAGPGLTHWSDSEIHDLVRVHLAAEITESMPEIDSLYACEVADAVQDLSAVLDPTTDPLHRQRVMAAAVSNARRLAPTGPAPF